MNSFTALAGQLLQLHHQGVLMESKEMQIGSTVQVQNADFIWPGAWIIAQGKDSLDGSRAVWLVNHHAFSAPIEFYQQADFQGRYYQPGNASMWMSHQQAAMPGPESED